MTRHRAALLLIILLAPAAAHALPTFARKYKTSCQTCHVAYPKLTPFGDAFRRNNYHFPDGVDEDYVKVEDVKLGAEGYKKVFPKAVWPGAIPGHFGMSAVAIGRASASTRGDAKLSFAGAGGEIQLTAAGALGDSISLWAGAILQASVTPEDERVNLILHRVFLSYSIFEKPWLIVRAGRLEPSILSFSAHRMLFAGYRFLSTTVVDNHFALEPAQLGFELCGTLFHRLGYAFGVVDGAGNTVTTPKDIYGALRFKLGGLALDGSTRGQKSDLLANPAPWREWSVNLGAFAYRGVARLEDPSSEAFADDRFVIVGGDVSLQLRDVNLIGVFTFQRNESPKLALPQRPVHVQNLMVQADWVGWPWLIPMLRYELRRYSGEVVGPALDREYSHYLGGALHVLIRANVAAALRFEVGKEGHNHWELGSLGLFLTGAL
jgi:hypothetical protein